MAIYKKVSANRKLQGEKVPLNDNGQPIDRGLPSVPRGLNREMTAYLQSMHNVVLSMTGLGRGTTDTRAVRVNEGRYGSGGSGTSGKDFLGAGSVLTAHLANGAVTEEKIADKAVTHAKLGISAVESNNIKPGAVDNATIKKGAVSTDKLADRAVTTEKLADKAVTTGKLADKSVVAAKLADGAVTNRKIADNSITIEKLAPELLPVFVSGVSAHGTTVNLGKWLERPVIVMTGQRIPVGECGELCAGIENLRQENGVWMFEAVAVFEMGIEDGINCYPGEISWLAVGRRENDAGTQI